MNSTFLYSFSRSRYFVPVLLGLLTLVLFLFALQFEDYAGSADNYVHFRISYYSFTHPHLFLDHWGKPVFTLFSAPFALFGIKGFLFFNVLSGVLACFFTYKIAQKLNLKPAILAFVMALSMPVYYVMMASAMTEIFFSLILMVAVYLLLCEKYNWSAVVFSMLFLVRTEGYVLYPVVMFIYAYKKQWLALPLIGTFTFIYSIIGGFYYDDFLWLINQIPYNDSSDLYGTGEWYYFIMMYDEIFGLPVTILICIGFLQGVFQFILDFFRDKKIKIDFLLIEVLFLLYFAAHSYVWWSGGGGSAGLIRVMAAVSPLMAITGLRPISWLFGKFTRIKITASVFVLVLSGWMLYQPFRIHKLPLMFGEREKTVEAAVAWYQQSVYASAKVYSYDPHVCFLLNRDPFVDDNINEVVDDVVHPENVTKPGEIIIYDMHFGPNEGGMPLENLLDNPHFELVNYFEPLLEMKVLGGYRYGVYLFKRVVHDEGNNRTRLKKLRADKIKTKLWKKLIKSDKKITAEEFTTLYEGKTGEIEGLLDAQILKAEMTYSLNDISAPFEKYLVISIEVAGEPIIYMAKPLQPEKINEEYEIANEVLRDKNLSGEETIKIYIWSKTNQTGVIRSLDVYTVHKKY